MKRGYRSSFFLIFTMSCFIHSLFGQIGLRSAYQLNTFSNWNQYFQSQDLEASRVFETSLQYALDYQFKLKDTRIEFYPYVSYHTASSSLRLTPSSIELRQFGMGLRSHFYIFDMIGDCECPTFTKQGSILKKGFFLSAGLGADLSSKKIGSAAFDDQNIDIKFSAGLGLDLGINELLTLTPFASFQYYPSISWHELRVPFGGSSGNVETSLSQIQLGLRVGFHLK